MNNKVVIITGAAGGLGRAFALAFAKEGAIVVASDINETAVKETIELIEQTGGKGVAITTDVSKEIATKILVNKVISEFGQIDILVNNAAIYAGIERKPFYEISEQEWDLVMKLQIYIGGFACHKTNK